MLIVLCLRQLNDLWGKPIYQSKLDLSASIGPVSTDSRKIIDGSFYVPLIGKTFDGHNFIAQAFERGAQAAVVARDFSEKVPKGCPHWLVEDTLKAFQQIALLHRCALNIPVVAITGSVGKTTTRELIKEVITPLGDIVSSSANNNNDIGVPLTLFQAKESNAAIILEMGMRGLGEIQRLSCCSQPDIAVITNIGTAHIGRLGSRENIAIAKCEITSCLKPDGVVVIPANDPLLEETLMNSWQGKVVRVAISEEPFFASSFSKEIDTLNLSNYHLLGKLNLKDDSLEVDGKIFKLPLPGRHNAENFMLALAVAKELGISFKEINEITINRSPGRNNLFVFDGITILDETYNSSPESVKASLDLLVSKPGRHFAVLGSMLELGNQSIELHRQVAKRTVDLGLDGLVVVGKGREIESMVTAARGLPRLSVATTPEDAFNCLRPWLKSGDVILLKASRAVELERLLPFLLNIFKDSQCY